MMEASPSDESSPLITLSPTLTDIPIYGGQMGLSSDPSMRSFEQSMRRTMMSIEMPPPFSNGNTQLPIRPSSAPPTTPSELKAIGLDRESYFSAMPKATPIRMLGGYFDGAVGVEDPNSMLGGL